MDGKGVRKSPRIAKKTRPTLQNRAVRRVDVSTGEKRRTPIPSRRLEAESGQQEDGGSHLDEGMYTEDLTVEDIIGISATVYGDEQHINSSKSTMEKTMMDHDKVRDPLMQQSIGDIVDPNVLTTKVPVFKHIDEQELLKMELESMTSDTRVSGNMIDIWAYLLNQEEQFLIRKNNS
ncbi:hypothetical protein L6452_03376 [Arctium lappa]|uniref:Uncharacterized protein n=1 Tax=Arctium lappa TaxID=4217 RepID=A0ACB9FN17_ARCLA|nr:hypothetical protein L6452_03376 [Arctium lappa]